MDRFLSAGGTPGMRFAGNEQSLRDQQKIEALARYLSGVRSNAQGLPRADMLPRFGPGKASDPAASFSTLAVPGQSTPFSNPMFDQVRTQAPC